ncbi:MAG: magnesium transporter [Gemmataceae bacterium]|nr:magnesium transporter [Gemmataceae bacterium]
MPDPLFTPIAKQYLAANDSESMKEFVESLHPATVAESLSEEFPVEDVWRFLHATDQVHQADVFAYFPLEWQLRMVDGTGRQQMASLIEEMSSDDRAELVRGLPGPVREQLLRLVDEADRKDIARLIQYPENAAGGLMTTDYAWLPADINVETALERLRLQAPNTETIYYVYVVDEGRKLKGVVSLRDLILSPRTMPLREIMETQVFSVRDTDDKERVAQEFGEYDLLAMPVIDAEGRLVGIITSDDVLDVVVEEATEDAHRMGAVGPLEDNYLETSFVKVWWNRAFWLSMLFVAEMFTFNAMAHYDEAMKVMTVLALFVPLCISTGGNSGSQAATLITRAMALGQVKLSDWWKALRHELLMGMALGVTLGLIAGVRTYYMTSASLLENPGGAPATDLWGLTIVISCAVTAICLYGTLIGSMLPLVFKRLGADPGVASSPFVATFVDVTGILIYFNIAKLVFGAALG